MGDPVRTLGTVLLCAGIVLSAAGLLNVAYPISDDFIAGGPVSSSAPEHLPSNEATSTMESATTPETADHDQQDGVTVDRDGERGDGTESIQSEPPDADTETDTGSGERGVQDEDDIADENDSHPGNGHGHDRGNSNDGDGNNGNGNGR